MRLIALLTISASIDSNITSSRFWMGPERKASKLSRLAAGCFCKSWSFISSFIHKMPPFALLISFDVWESLPSNIRLVNFLVKLLISFVSAFIVLCCISLHSLRKESNFPCSHKWSLFSRYRQWSFAFEFVAGFCNIIGINTITAFKAILSLERPTLASRVPLFLLGHFLTNECEISDFCL